ELGEHFGFRVCPLNGFRMPIDLILKIGLELLLQRQRTRKIVRGEHVTLHLAEDDLDLIEPTGVRRQPVNPAFKGQCPRRNPRSQLFRGASRPDAPSGLRSQTSTSGLQRTMPATQSTVPVVSERAWSRYRESDGRP